jgi:hypothetical protein
VHTPVAAAGLLPWHTPQVTEVPRPPGERGCTHYKWLDEWGWGRFPCREHYNARVTIPGGSQWPREWEETVGPQISDRHLDLRLLHPRKLPPHARELPRAARQHGPARLDLKVSVARCLWAAPRSRRHLDRELPHLHWPDPMCRSGRSAEDIRATLAELGPALPRDLHLATRKMTEMAPHWYVNELDAHLWIRPESLAPPDWWNRFIATLGVLGDGGPPVDNTAQKPWVALTLMVQGCAAHCRFRPDMSGVRPPEALPRWRAPVLAEWSGYPQIMHLPQWLMVEYETDGPSFEHWPLRSRAPKPARWGGGDNRAIATHVKFRPREAVVEMRRARPKLSWTDAGGKRWHVGKRKKEPSAYELYLGAKPPPLPQKEPNEARVIERARKAAVHHGQGVGARFLVHQTPLISHNRVWRAAVVRLFADASHRHPLGKRTRLDKDESRPTYVGRENARYCLLYTCETLEALSGIENASSRAWQIAPDEWLMPELHRALKRLR